MVCDNVYMYSNLRCMCVYKYDSDVFVLCLYGVYMYLYVMMSVKLIRKHVLEEQIQRNYQLALQTFYNEHQR